MQALVCQAGEIKLMEVDTPMLQQNEVRIQVRAIGINRADILQRRGFYPAPEGFRSDILGLECAGVVIECHDDIPEVEQQRLLGQRVMTIVGGEAYAAEVTVHQEHLIPVPECWSFEEAAAFPEAFLTAFDALWLQADLEAHHQVLIHAVTSGVGDAARQLCEYSNIEVWGTTRSADKQQLLTDTKCHLVLAEDGQLPSNLPTFDRILDLVGAAYFSQNIELLAYRGHLQVIGLLGGVQTEIGLHRLLQKNATIRASTMRNRNDVEKATICAAFLDRFGEALNRSEIHPTVDKIFSWKEVDAAHQRMVSNQHIGKLVLVVD